MGSEKRQLQAILVILGLIGVCVVMFLLIGGEFLWFSTEGLIGPYLWAVPIVILVVQQLYAIPRFLKGYWTLFSDEAPSTGDLYTPFVNENKILPSAGCKKFIIVAWVVVGVMILPNVLVLIGVSFLAEAIGGLLGIGGMGDFTYYTLMIAIIAFVLLSLVRGAQYMVVRKEIYNLHNKYIGTRGTGFVSWFYRILYFVPLVRTLSFLMEIQILDKLTKFNEVEDMKIVLRED